MKKLVLIALALGAAAPAMAQNVNTTFTVNGTVAGKCTIATGGTFAINGTGAISTDSTGALTGTNTGTSAPVLATCNAAGAQINVSKVALVHSDATLTDTAFNTKTINFDAKATIGGVDYAEGQDRALGVVNGNLTVTASNLSTSGGLRPYAGSYSGTITVTLKPGA